MYEVLHRPVVARNDDHKLVPVVLHGLEQGLDGLAAEVVLAPGGEGVGLVDEEHAAYGLFDDLAGAQRGLADVARHEPGAVHLYELALLERADGGVEPGEQSCHGRLAGAGVAGEHHVQAHRRAGQTRCLAQAADFYEVHQAANLALHALQADERVELGHELVEVGLLGGLFLGLGGGRGGLAGGLGAVPDGVLVYERGLAAGDKVLGV